MILALFLLMSCGGAGKNDQKVEQKDTLTVLDERVTLADPFIMLYQGTYYAYGTNADDGIEVYVSDDLRNWRRKGLALTKGDVWGDHWFWAPEVYEVNGLFYMYYSAEEHICVATAQSPLGPFRQTVRKPMIEGEKCIDNSLFVDEDGKAYLFFDRFNDGLNIWVAELEEDLMTVKEHTMHPCIHVSQAWEEVWPRVNEGGRWEKYEDNPLLQKPEGLVGVGHSAMFTDKEGNMRIVYHAHKDSLNIHPRAMYIGKVDFIQVDGKDKMRISKDYLIPRLIK